MIEPYATPPRWYGDERGLPPCRDPEHRHSGRCEDWTIPPEPWATDIGVVVTIGNSHDFRVTHTHRPTGCTVAVEGNHLDRLHATARTELRTMLIGHLRTEAADLFRRSDNALMIPGDHASVVRVGDLRERAQRLTDEADAIEKGPST